MKKALERIKVTDFSWAGTGPAAARYLADHGAMVIRIESPDRPDVLRTSPPFKDKKPGLDRSGYFANYNAGKYGITLNLSHPQGPEIAKLLVKWADIVLESFAPGTMAKWGLNYEQLKEIKPEIIMASTTQFGQWGPFSQYRGFGFQGAAIGGFWEITGWPDGMPVGPYAAYTDFIAHRYLVIALIAALEYRRQVGKGLYIDQSQIETGINFLAPAILDYTTNGRVMSRKGNRSHMPPRMVLIVVKGRIAGVLSQFIPTPKRSLRFYKQQEFRQAK